MEEKNCWDAKNCPEERKQSCPAFKNDAGKRCWIVTGTMCGGVQQGSMQDKLGKCHECDFFKSRDGIPN